MSKLLEAPLHVLDMSLDMLPSVGEPSGLNFDNSHLFPDVFLSILRLVEQLLIGAVIYGGLDFPIPLPTKKPLPYDN